MRDIAFYVGATFMVWFILWRTRIYLKNAIALVAVYVCYIAVVIIGRYFYLKTKKAKDAQKSETSSVGSTDVSVISDSIDKTSKSSPDPEAFGANITFKSKSNRNLTTKRQTSRSLSEEQDIVLTRFYRRGTLRTPRHSRANSFVKKLTRHHHDNVLAVIERNYDDQYNKVLDKR
ncbi:unnamed protein product, partial [Oppiella nova]